MKSDQPAQDASILLVANWDSGVGYAWWLIESFWVALSLLYKNRRHTVLAYPSVSTIPASIAQAPIHIQTIDFTRTSFADVVGQLRFISRNKVETIYFTDQAYWHWRYLAYRLIGVKRIVIHDHTPGQRTRPKAVKRFVKCILARAPWLNCDAVIGVSDYIGKRAIDVSCVPPDKTFVAPNGLPRKVATEAENIRNLFGIPDTSVVMVTTGRAVEYKGIPFGLNCMNKLVREQGLDIHWLFCGDGPDLDKFKQETARLSLEDRITWAGRRSDIPGLLQACDFAFHPSRGEVGYSLSILEYMQAGLPVVVSDNPSVCLATENKKTGIIYEEDDLESACEAIRIFAEDSSQRRVCGERAKDAAVEYSLENTHKALCEAMQYIDPCLESS